MQDLLLLGKEASRLIEEWLEFSRDLLVAKQTGDMIGRSEAFVAFAKEVEEAFFISLYGCFKSNATRNAIYDKTNH